ncbi:2-hydroxymuconic semialdehyde dehydrogenase [Sphingobium sp. AR-3-1]|jgi:aminomuconate-semialdehyde/2-hydroxymuconate-6-semialdehyde dehydrogenase|uniref:2-hydroxymuconic semialdehyde dehydrogenase n=2 Tax=Sphingomonadaceae TaxID=41297 RepID=A0A7X9ZW25_9SPHN|nr:MULTISPECIES: 2-hydroxymuconic semialdehyde dehydrogenase [Sphingobium]ART38645.1 G504 [uncultured bacterium]NML12969.1 2-hydroxymuconic semialdehyde dehydrogenase [Sphingobium psychrophilum]PBN41478.1 2-hydroxymuconic semialdehyde dehydrogenase [Sphingobium sp. D43FB]
MTTNSPRPVADHILNFIGGSYRKGSQGKTFDNVNPATGQTIGTVYEASEADVADAVAAAKAALDGPWGKMTTAERVKLIVAVAAEIERRADDFLDAEVADTGKPRHVASHIDIPRGAANFRMFADVIATMPGESFTTPTPDGGQAINYAVRKAKGVIAVICPWNFPLLLMTWKVGPALACGNTVVVKPSEETPRTAALLGEVMNAVGMPQGVYNVVHGFGGGSAGEFLTSNKDVDAITFTGETGTGQAIMQKAAVGVRDVSFELGGKNAAIVFADADLDKAIEGLSRSVFLNTGQVCLGTERVYVERPLFDEFVRRMTLAAQAFKPGSMGDPAYLGPLSSAEHRDKVLGYYAKAVEEGATVVTGGGVPKVEGDQAGGFYVEPTLWTGLAHDATVIREEIFGPCCGVIPFDSEDEVIALANDTDYGLCATVWTENVSRAHRVAAAMQVGVCWVNCWFLRDLRTAFGGSGHSGIGREGGVHSLEFYTETANICVKL